MAIVSLWVASLAAAAPLPEASASRLPRWRGFNLLEKFQFHGKHEPYREDDFRLIGRFGFNFVRLPVDYRGYIAGGNWERFDDTPLRQIDQAITWGGAHGVHVCLNLHRAPGWTVAKPPEAKDLWSDPEAQRVAALHWAMFARRYKGTPNSRLSFNLFNEPAGISAEVYLPVVRKMLEAIRAEDPSRLVFCDGLQWGTKPVPELIPLGVAMMTRGYAPFGLTHYRAGWIEGSDGWELPRWPETGGTTGSLLGPAKGGLSRPLRIEGPLAAGTTVRVEVATVSARATLAVEAGGKELLRREFVADPESGIWRKVERDPRWDVFRAEGQVSFPVALPAAAKEVSLRVVDGDWLVLGAVGITPPGGGQEAGVRLRDGWGEAPETLLYRPSDNPCPTLGVRRGREWLRRETVEKWQPFTAAGGAVMVGEWGAFQHTPHATVLRWAEDGLRNWREAGWGWALWNFRGSFGILDSGRADVEYEEFEGHQLDRKFLELLQRY